VLQYLNFRLECFLLLVTFHTAAGRIPLIMDYALFVYLFKCDFSFRRMDISRRTVSSTDTGSRLSESGFQSCSFGSRYCGPSFERGSASQPSLANRSGNLVYNECLDENRRY